MIMKELISSIQYKLSKIEEGIITLAEMEQLVSDSRELNERLIVLRYKVYEQGVLGIEITNGDEKIMEEPLAEIEIDIVSEEIEIPEDSIELREEADGNTEFDIPFELDLFAEKEDIEQDENSSEETDEEIILANNTFFTTSFDEETGIEEQVVTHEETLIIEEEHATIIVEKEEKTIITNINESVEEPVKSESITPSFESISSTSNTNSETALRIKSIEQSLRSNYSIMPLDTLIGSFTLNERLQFINELFEGSSDAFSTAVKKLDSQENLISARSIVAEYAQNNQWDLESEIVEDFLVKICRRYAADLSA
jgi:hypothetical protein